MKFTGKLRLELHDTEPGRFVVVERFQCTHGNETVTLEPGLMVNGASVPRPFNLLFPPWHPDYNLASAVHDALVGEFDQTPAMVMDQNGIERYLSWEEAAEWFYRAMRTAGTRKWKAQLFYRLVLLKKVISHAL